MLPRSRQLAQGLWREARRRGIDPALAQEMRQVALQALVGFYIDDHRQGLRETGSRLGVRGDWSRQIIVVDSHHRVHHLTADGLIHFNQPPNLVCGTKITEGQWWNAAQLGDWQKPQTRRCRQCEKRAQHFDDTSETSNWRPFSPSQYQAITSQAAAQLETSLDPGRDIAESEVAMATRRVLVEHYREELKRRGEMALSDAILDWRDYEQIEPAARAAGYPYPAAMLGDREWDWLVEETLGQELDGAPGNNLASQIMNMAILKARREGHEVELAPRPSS